MRRAIPFLMALLGLVIPSARAQPAPIVISFQGRLTDADGKTVPDGAYQLQVRLYDQPGGGTVQWTETQVVTTRKGLFTALLGSVTPLESLSFEDGYYVALSINGSAELAPRTALAAVPYALNARRLDASALEAGSNVTITRQTSGALRIEATGGGTGGGLTRVSTDATLTGEGTAASPLRLSDEAVVAGQNVSVSREQDGSFVIDATGGGGGLSRVATDATLGGDGTTGNPLSLADGAVTGVKLSDTALRAGANTTITRRGDGSIEIAATATPLSLPYTGSTGSGGPALSVENTGGGDGIYVANAGDDGVEVSSATFGLFVNQASDTGVLIGNAGSSGVAISTAGGAGLSVGTSSIGVEINTTSSDGIVVRNAGRHGLLIQNAPANFSDGLHVEAANQDGVEIGAVGRHGMIISSASGNGFQVGSAGVDGLQVQSAGRDGVQVGQAFNGLSVLSASRGIDINTTTEDGVLLRNPGRHGLLIQNAGSKGIQIDQAGNNGLQIDQAGLNGLQIGQTTFDGIQIQSPGRDGIRISGAGGLAGFFGGDVQVTGTLSKGGGSFKIDHPLDPANQYLSHSFVESPDMMNVYNGNAVLDAAGEAWIDLPAYFEALNRDFRYQLTAIGAPGPNLYVAEKISGNRFRIAGGTPGMEVSWQVTGIRQDAWANDNRIVVEEVKSTDERGYYLHPEAFGQPRDRRLSARDTARERP